MHFFNILHGLFVTHTYFQAPFRTKVVVVCYNMLYEKNGILRYEKRD